MDFFEALLRAVGPTIGILLAVLAWVYFFPGSPLRKIIETWIDGRVRAQFDRDADKFRHGLSLEAERVKAKYQNDLHSFGIVTVRQHEVFRELHRLLFMADGAVGGLYGGMKLPDFKKYSRENVIQYMAARRFAGEDVASILGSWDTNRDRAIDELQKADRLVAIALAEVAYREAWNYMLTNSLYLPDSVTDICREVSDVLWSILGAAQFPGPSGTDIIASKAKSTELLWQLRKELQRLLGVTQQAFLDTPRQTTGDQSATASAVPTNTQEATEEATR